MMIRLGESENLLTLLMFLEWCAPNWTMTSLATIASREFFCLKQCAAINVTSELFRVHLTAKVSLTRHDKSRWYYCSSAEERWWFRLVIQQRHNPRVTSTQITLSCYDHLRVFIHYTAGGVIDWWSPGWQRENQGNAEENKKVIHFVLHLKSALQHFTVKICTEWNSSLHDVFSILNCAEFLFLMWSSVLSSFVFESKFDYSCEKQFSWETVSNDSKRLESTIKTFLRRKNIFRCSF